MFAKRARLLYVATNLAAIESHWRVYGCEPTWIDLARFLCVTQSALGHRIEELRKRGLVETRPLRLSDAGRELLGLEREAA